MRAKIGEWGVAGILEAERVDCRRRRNINDRKGGFEADQRNVDS